MRGLRNVVGLTTEEVTGLGGADTRKALFLADGEYGAFLYKRP